VRRVSATGTAGALDRRLAQISAGFTPSPDALHALAARFQAEIARGLAGDGGSLKMLRTFVEQPWGDERGRPIVVDWGGTHGRVGAVGLEGQGQVGILREDAFTFTEDDKAAPADRVFDVIVAAVDRLVGGDRRTAYELAFVYSFPARLERIDRAIALSMTKGWRPVGLEGRDVAGLLGAALGRRGLGNVAVRAVANDTVAPMVLQTYRMRGRDRSARPAEVGLILGTGTNQAADLPGFGIRNLECGDFNLVSPLQTPHDVALDREVADPAPGAQLFEKMVSGQYLGEIVRRVVGDLAASTSLFQWSAVPAFRTPFGFSSVNLSRIEADESGDLSAVEALLRDLGIASSRLERLSLRAVSRLVVARSARLVATTLVGTLRQIDPALARPHTIAVDGSLWGGYPGYDGLVRAAFEELVGAETAARIRPEFVRDSTAAGAAVIAAVAGRERTAGGAAGPG
jgi:hexokinase